MPKIQFAPAQARLLPLGVTVVGVQRYSTAVAQLDSREKGGTVPCFSDLFKADGEVLHEATGRYISILRSGSPLTMSVAASRFTVSYIVVHYSRMLPS